MFVISRYLSTGVRSSKTYPTPHHQNLVHDVSQQCGLTTQYACSRLCRVTTEKSARLFFVNSILGAFANLWRVIISFVVSVCPSVRPYGKPRLQLDGFSWNFIFECFSKVCRETSISFWNLTRITGTLYEDQNTFMKFHICVSVHHQSILLINQIDAALSSLIYSLLRFHSTCFECFLHPSSGVQLKL
jgi:hypothetical protein